MSGFRPVSLLSACKNLDVDFIGNSEIGVSSVTLDSRQVEPGGLFACVPGEHTNGHDFAGEAVKRGAVALLVEEPVLGIDAAKITTVRTPDARRVLGTIAARVYGEPSLSLKCFGVTGTNGKTTTVHLLAEIATAAGEQAATLGTLGTKFAVSENTLTPNSSSGLTTPEAPELQSQLGSMLANGIETVAMEVSSHSLAQFRVDGTHFRIVCFTNLGHDHLDFHLNMASYFDAKARLFDATFTEMAALNIDDPAGSRLVEIAKSASLPTITFGLSEKAEITATAIEYSTTGSRFTLVDRRNDESIDTKINLLGQMNVANALGAAATAMGAGYSLIEIANGLNNSSVIPGRMESVATSTQFMVLVDYAHTPEALSAALTAARVMAAGNRVLLAFGCGGGRDFEKRSVMGEVAVRDADFVVVTSDNPRSEDPAEIANQIIATIDSSQVELELDRRRAIRRVLGEAGTGDVVVVAGKGHETGQIATGKAIPFNDREVIREELAARR